MVTTGDDDNLAFFNLIYETMFAVDPTGPATRKLEAERLRFSGPIERGATNLFEKSENSVSLTFVGL
ncbi:hypothetical protein GPICK_14450 [Geobacter pickeringii]|uniref:Uncharacterized protein n=1 Tax=Geobacter pickeringii TaxID=345632 RepID=A0A0B5BIV3_9BACT|nr:hypothetical protein GPICK_14450 [Geobacter pickeringii]